MKIRNGFVSNSSTSSFLIYGACVGKDSVPESKQEEYGSDWKEYIAEVAKEHGLGFEYGQYMDWGDDCAYAGECPTDMRDDQTMGEWKKEIEEKARKAFGDDTKCNWHEDAWYNG